MILIDFHNRLLGEFPAGDWQEPAWVNGSGMANKHNALAIVNAERRALNSARFGAVNGLAHRVSLKVHNKPAVERRFGCFNGIGLMARMLPELAEYLFILLGKDAFFGSATANGY